ncbi:Thiol-disulfide oxidoreductase ResA [compost metagenome]
MKKSIVLLFLFVFAFSFAQNGKMKLKNDKFQSGQENEFIYESPQGLVIPENAVVTIAYEGYITKSFPLTKNEANYQFKIKVPDSIDILYLAVADSKKNTIDNNGEKGYVVYLNNTTKTALENAQIKELNLVGFANYALKLKIAPAESIKRYDELFKQNPKLKETDAYKDYLFLLYRENKEETKPKLTQLAEKLETKKDEKSLNAAYDIYYAINSTDKLNATKKLILSKYPQGEVAKNDFWKDFYENKDKTESYVLESLKSYNTKFSDHSTQTDDRFYSQLLPIYLKNKDTLNLTKYENLIVDKFMIANIYNNYAWEASGQDLITPAKDIDFIENISKKTLTIVKERMANPKESDDPAQLEGMYNMFADTYALILYKQKKYDLAFQYQDEIAKLDGLDTGGKERYAGYAEKVKGLEFTKNYLEQQIAAGVDSAVMLNQLREIYKKMNLPLDQFEKLKGNADKIAADKNKEDLIKTYGSAQAIDFSLVNLEGKKISLADYKGKTVVLDFWATWCGPCRASFPGMQELITKYKGKDVVFLFIDVWEKGEAKDIEKNVSKFISDHKYDFNVLYDFKDDIVAKYKVKGIPSKIVINKEGNIVNANAFISHENLIALIEENIK